MLKEELRTNIKKRINQLSKEECVNYSQSIADKLLTLDEYKRAQTIFVYNSFGCEVKTDYIINKALEEGKNVCLPITEGDIMYAVRVCKNTQYQQNDWGISEPLSKEMVAPAMIDLTLTPLVGFDRQGNRLGRGKGYYDRYLTGLTSAKIALAYSIQEENVITTDNYDVKVDIIVTEKEIIHSEAFNGLANGIFG